MEIVGYIKTITKEWRGYELGKTQLISIESKNWWTEHKPNEVEFTFDPVYSTDKYEDLLSLGRINKTGDNDYIAASIGIWDKTVSELKREWKWDSMMKREQPSIPYMGSKANMPLPYEEVDKFIISNLPKESSKKAEAGNYVAPAPVQALVKLFGLDPM